MQIQLSLIPFVVKFSTFCISYQEKRSFCEHRAHTRAFFAIGQALQYLHFTVLDSGERKALIFYSFVIIIGSNNI